MKKLISLVLAAVMALSLVACGSGSKDKDTDTGDKTYKVGVVQLVQHEALDAATKGFTDALRMELMDENAPISVTLIKPASIDTPLPQRARNYMDREPSLPPPIYPPGEVANAILHAAVHPQRDGPACRPTGFIDHGRRPDHRPRGWARGRDRTA